MHLILSEISGGVATRLREGRSGFNFLQGQETFLFSVESRPTLRPTQPPKELVSGTASPGVKRPRREADRTH
jgi:hypothetical protein